MKHKEELKEIIKAYRDRGITCDQNELIQLLREVQALFGGVIPQKALEKTAEKLELKMTFIDALLKRYPSIRTEDAPHTLSVCGGKTAPRGRRCRILWNGPMAYRGAARRKPASATR